MHNTVTIEIYEAYSPWKLLQVLTTGEKKNRYKENQGQSELWNYFH